MSSTRPGGVESGTGSVRSGQRDLGITHYEIHVAVSTGSTTVELESPPKAQDGEILDLTLEDGRVLQLQVRGVSPYCRVIGERPAHERRRPPFDAPVSPVMDQSRRRSDARGPTAISHPCPRCMATEVLVTHRGVVLTTLFCTSCRHGWGEPPAAIAGATRIDRRAVARDEQADRRSGDRLATPTCAYCSTDIHVQTTRRTPQEVYFVCSSCDAMFVVPRPNARPGQASRVLS